MEFDGFHQGPDLVINTDCSIAVLNPAKKSSINILLYNRGAALGYSSLHIMASSLTVAESRKGLHVRPKGRRVNLRLPPHVWCSGCLYRFWRSRTKRNLLGLYPIGPETVGGKYVVCHQLMPQDVGENVVESLTLQGVGWDPSQVHRSKRGCCLRCRTRRRLFSN